jgi:SAM-dependent methyltransferase
MTSAYEMLASEYYDSTRHPTCANFRVASKAIVRAWLADFSRTGDSCEIGCGMSVLAELLEERKLPLNQLHLVDSSTSMLRYSSKWTTEGALLAVADATMLPFENDAIDLCVASLGDPYNETAFWAEISRVLAPGGSLLFTTPSYEWASLYRTENGVDSVPSTAEFTLLNGSMVSAPSMVLAADSQIGLIEDTKNLKVSDTKPYTFSQLPKQNISHKLLVTRDADLPVVTGYRVQKLG